MARYDVGDLKFQILYLVIEELSVRENVQYKLQQAWYPREQDVIHPLVWP